MPSLCARSGPIGPEDPASDRRSVARSGARESTWIPSDGAGAAVDGAGAGVGVAVGRNVAAAATRIGGGADGVRVGGTLAVATPGVGITGAPGERRESRSTVTQ